MPEQPSSADTGTATPASSAPSAERTTVRFQLHHTHAGDEATPARAGRHLLLGEIARGGIGVILRGQDPALGRELAVKVLRADHRDNPEMRQRFLEEAQIGGQLQHPGIVPVYELSWFDDGRPFFTMKLVQGRTFAALLDGRPDPRDDLPRFLTIFEQVCQTVAFAHSRGVIHRDLKPSNVMVGGFGEVQVMDWGLAKVLPRDSVTGAPVARSAEESKAIQTVRSGSTAAASRTGAVLGTPAFMPPEQARGEVDRIDERADVFGLGAILCVILTGQPPYGQSYDLIDQALRAALADACARLDRCGADAELIRLCKDCLAPERDDRPRDAGVVAERVAEYEAGVQERLRRAELDRAAAQARAEEAKATAAAERRARRRSLALAGVVLLFVLTVGGAALWWGQQRAARMMEVAADLTAGEKALWEGNETEARAAAARAEARLGDGPADLHDRLVRLRADIEIAVKLKREEQERLRAEHERAEKIERERQARLRADRDMAAELEESRLEQADERDGFFDIAAAAKRLEKAFRGYGLDIDVTDPADAVERIRQSSIPDHLIAALDHWIYLLSDEDGARRAWLQAVVQQADPDEWRGQFRAAVAAQDRPTLEKLAAKPAVAELPPATLVLLAKALNREGARADALRVLQQAQRRHPGDLWINHDLAMMLMADRPPRSAEAVSYYRVALAARPHSPGILVNLGIALVAQKNPKEAESIFREALALKPEYAQAHNNLGVALKAQDKLADAETAFRKALEFKADFALAHCNLGETLRLRHKLPEAEAVLREVLDRLPNDLLADAHYQLGAIQFEQDKFPEAEKEFRQATDLKKGNPTVHYTLGIALAKQTKPREAEAEFRKAIALRKDFGEAYFNLAASLQDQNKWAEAEAPARKAADLLPDDVEAYYKFGLILFNQGKYADAEPVFRDALKIKPDYAEILVNLGAALNAQGKWRDGEEACRAALKIKPKLFWAHYNLGNSLMDQAKWADAESAYREATKLNPTFAQAHCNLGHVLRREGKFADALESLRRGHELGLKTPGWNYDSADWVRTAERLVALESKLPAILEGKEKPTNDSERLTLAQMCHEHKRLYAAAARFYGEVLKSQPRLADDLRQPHRYNAACSAALAASGKGEDAAGLDETERTRLRKQALDWLTADLALWAKLAEDKAEVREQVREQLKHWQSDADLAGVRDKETLDKLPEAERDAWRKLWDDVAAVRKAAEKD
jgi:serine/threonine-protein kinase